MHHVSAPTFSGIIDKCSARYKIGLSGTLQRKDGKHVYLDDYFTDFKSYAKDPRILLDPKIEIISTDIPFMVIDPKRDWSRQINKLSKNSNYIKLIAKISLNIWFLNPSFSPYNKIIFSFIFFNFSISNVFIII